MSLPIERILWAETNSAHDDHLHVVGEPRVHGHLKEDCSWVWTDAIEEIVNALDVEFGKGAHFEVDPDAAWTHMGVYNCRPIAGTNIPSQHAFSNAIDIGPYYGVEGQQVFYDFLVREDDDSMAFNEHEEAELKRIVASLDEVDSNGSFAKFAVKLIRESRSKPLHVASFDGVDEQARSLANRALGILENVKKAI